MTHARRNSTTTTYNIHKSNEKLPANNERLNSLWAVVQCTVLDGHIDCADYLSRQAQLEVYYLTVNVWVLL